MQDMVNHLNDCIARLPERHRYALSWFSEHAGTEQSWPLPLQTPWGDTLLATKAKGIYKPSWSTYALSVRQTLDSPYQDEPPIYRPDGTWFYRYFQENEDSLARDEKYTNRALLDCWQDSVPVGVMLQTSEKPRVRYHVLGLSLVAGWDGGYFFLEGFAPNGLVRERGPVGEIEALMAEASRFLEAGGEFNPSGVFDGRRRILSQIVRRQGQPDFRARLLAAYDYRCAISNYSVAEVLEAAHIVPFHKLGTNHVQNGLLLRADLHVLFDRGLLSIHEGDLSLLMTAKLRESSYGNLSGQRLRLPTDPSCWPSRVALREHRVWAGL